MMKPQRAKVSFCGQLKGAFSHGIDKPILSLNTTGAKQVTRKFRVIKGVPVDKPTASGRNTTALQHQRNHTSHFWSVCQVFHQVSHCSDLSGVVLPRAPCVNNSQVEPTYLVPMRNMILQCLRNRKRWKVGWK